MARNNPGLSGFLSRLDAHRAELERLLGVWNRGRAKTSRARLTADAVDIDAFLAMLQRSWEKRRAPLRAVDERRGSDPSWLDDNRLWGMHVDVAAFANTLEGLRKKLPYVQECGVNYLHVSGISPDAADEVRAFAASCRRRDIVLCADYEVSPSDFIHSKKTKAPKRAKKPAQSLLEGAVERILAFANLGIDVIHLEPVPLGPEGSSRVQLERKRFDPATIETIMGIVYLSCRIVCPGVVLLGDVADHLGNSSLIRELHIPQQDERLGLLLHDVAARDVLWHTVATRDVRLMRRHLQLASELHGRIVFQNTLHGGRGDAWHLDYPFLQHIGMNEIPHRRYLNDWFTGTFEGSWSRGKRLPGDLRGEQRVRGTTASWCGLESALDSGDGDLVNRAVQCVIMVHAWMIALNGIPVIDSGDEIAQLNDFANDGASDGKAKGVAAAKRDAASSPQAGPFDWKRARRRHDARTVQGRVFLALEKLREIRRREPVFRADARVDVLWDESERILAFRRTRGEESLVAVFNFSEWFLEAQLPEGASIDLFSGRTFGVEKPALKRPVKPQRVLLTPYEFLLLKQLP